MFRAPILAALIALGIGGTATAQTDDLTQVRRLSPEEKERILNASSEAAADRALDTALGGGVSMRDAPKIHGEVGISVGTGGVGAFGTALVPLGENGMAILSFEDFRWNDSRRRYPRR